MESTAKENTQRKARLPHPRWLAAAAVVLAIWAALLTVWWSRVQTSPVVTQPATVPTRAIAAAITPRPSATATASPGSTLPLVPVVRSPGALVQAEDWTALATAFDGARTLLDIVELTAPQYAGRAVGSPGGKLAAEWIADRFAEYGLQPAGVDGSYMQEFPVPYAELTAMPAFELTAADGQVLKEYRLRSDYLFWLGGYSDGGSAEGPVLWVSDGRRDDYKGLNAEGALVLCRYRQPLADVLRAALEFGARAVLYVAPEGYNLAMRRTAREDALLPHGIPTLLVGPAAVRDLLEPSGLTQEDLSIQYQARPLGSYARVQLPLQFDEEATGQNVLGVLPGSDPDGRGQVFIIGAHYDHMGADPDATIWAGANDDASGVATLLEIARQWQEHGYVPLRTVLFAAWDAEEIGLNGSRYYVANPSFPLTATVGMLQLDMVGAGPNGLQIEEGGLVANQSAAAVRALGVPAVMVPAIGGSDHMPFASVNVPATAYIWWDGHTPGIVYHVPEDNANSIDVAKLEAAGEVAHLVTLSLVSDAEKLEDLRAILQSAIISGSIESYVDVLDPLDDALRRKQQAWLMDLSQSDTSDFTLTTTPPLIGSGVATSTLTMRYRWSSASDASSVSFPARWLRRGVNWYYAGPAWKSIEGLSTEVQYLNQPDGAQTIALATDSLRARMQSELGLGMPDPIRIRLYDTATILHALEVEPAGNEKASGWATSDGVVLGQASTLTDALLEMGLQEAGWPSDAASWLAEGIQQVWEVSSAPATDWVPSKYMSRLARADDDGTLWPAAAMPGRQKLDSTQEGLWEAQAWAMTEYLLATRASGTAFLQPTLTGVDAWHEAMLEPWRVAQQEINQALAQRAAAVLARDEATFLSTLDGTDSTLYAEERHWFADLQEYPASAFSLAGQLLSLEGDQAVVQINMTYRLAEADTSGSVGWEARFIRREGHWLYADAYFYSRQSEHFILKYMSDVHDSEAEDWLARAEAAYEVVALDLNYRPAALIELKYYDNPTLFRTSIFLSMLPAHGWAEPGEAIKLTDLAGADIARVVAHEMAHQALFARGVQHGGVHEGVGQYEAALYSPQWRDQNIRKWRRQVYDLVRSQRPVTLANMSDWRDWTDELELVYSVGWDVVTYFRQRYGRETFLMWLDLLGSGLSFDEALLQATGTPFARFDADWRESALRGHIPAEYVELAQGASGELALQHVELLAQPGWAGRQAGTAGNRSATAYIAERFQEYGLQPAGENGTFYQDVQLALGQLVSTPVLVLHGPDGASVELRYGVDFREVLGGRAGSGKAESSLFYVGSWQSEGLKFGGRVMVARASSDPRADVEVAYAQGAGGVVLVTSTLANGMAVRTSQHPTFAGQTIPAVEITQAAFESLLTLAGYKVGQLRSAPPALPLGIGVEMEVQWQAIPNVHVANVLGSLPGADVSVADEILILGAHLDHVGSLPDGTFYPGANDDASGVAVLLEIARLWHEGGYRPRRTVVFAAWNASEWGLLGSEQYIRELSTAQVTVRGMLELEMVGQGRGYYLSVAADESQEAHILAHMDNAAGRVEGRVNFVRYEEGSDHQPFHDLGLPAAVMSWERPEYSHMPLDTPDLIDPNKLAATGRLVALTFMTMADE